MSSLANQAINASYGYLIQIPGGLTSGQTGLQDGSGNALPMSASATGIILTMVGGTIDNVAIGSTTPASGKFTSLSASGAITLSGGTANGVLYLNGSDVVTSGSALVFDGANLGLGVTPSAWSSSFKALEIGRIGNAFAVNTSNGNTSFTANAYLNTSGWTYANNGYALNFNPQSSTGSFAWNIATSGTAGTAIAFTQAMTLDASGNLGIGTTSPSTYGKFVVNNSTASNSTVIAQALLTNRSYSTSNNGLSIVATASNGTLGVHDFGAITFNEEPNSNGGSAYVNMYAGGSSSSYGNGPRFLQAANGSGTSVDYLALWTGGSERMRIDSSGNVGIGTSSPSFKFDLQGGRSVLSANSEQYALGLRYNVATNGVWLGSPSSNAFAVYGFGGGEYMRIDSSGNLLVGTTGAGGKLTVNADTSTVAGNKVAIFSSTYSGGDSNYEVLALIKYANSTATTNIFQRFYINQGANGSGQINANGANAAAFGSFSDARLKENIVDLEPQLANILALRPVEFDYIESEGGGHQIGFIAQRHQKIYPDTVGDRGDGMLTITGWSKTEARLVKAIQEQHALIQELSAKVAELESKLN
jgi:Chaperone of endosialidase